MNRSMIACACALLMLVVLACNARSGSTSSGVSTESNVIEREKTAPVQETGKSFTYNFDGDTAGQMPAKFHAGLTGQGAKGVWDCGARSASRCMNRQTAQCRNIRLALWRSSLWARSLPVV